MQISRIFGVIINTLYLAMFIYYIIIYKPINWFAHQISLICLCVVDKLLKHFFKLLYKPTVNKDNLLTYKNYKKSAITLKNKILRWWLFRLILPIICVDYLLQTPSHKSTIFSSTTSLKFGLKWYSRTRSLRS